jgi:hypothetical protein
MAAGRAAELGGSVTIAEKMSSTARKLRITGGGRCNVTNVAMLNDFILHFGASGKFIRHAIARFSSQDLISFFKKLGVPIVVEADGRAYPSRGSAETLARALEHWSRTQGVDVVTGFPARRLIERDGRIEGIAVQTYSARNTSAVQSAASSEHVIQADAVILATGGASYPATGSTGDGCTMAKRVGHRVVPLRPALVPLLARCKTLSQLQGLSLENVEVTLVEGDRRVAQERGELIFAHFGISGPAVLNISRYAVIGIERGSSVKAHIDFLPEQSDDQLTTLLLEQFNAHGNKMVRSVLSGFLPARLATALIFTAGVDPDKKANQITSRERRSIVRCCKEFVLEISGHRSFREAMVTSGGVDLSEVNPRTMESKLVRGLYFAGEVLDIDADTGGFNLQAAFSTGWLAGTSASIGSS